MHRIVIDGFGDVKALGGRGVTLVRTTKAKGYQRRKPVVAVLAGAAGLLAEQVKAGTLIGGLRVVGMTVGRTAEGVRIRRCELADGTWTGWLADGERVPGTRKRTDFPAGPVGAGRGQRATKVDWRDGESGTDRNARRIDAIVYG